MSTTTRRRFLAGAGAAGAGVAVAGAPGTALAHPGKGRAVRILHFTDAHVTPDIARSEPETRRALKLGLRYKPDLVLQSGDAIYDALYADKPTVDKQWAAHKRIYEGIRTPVAHAIGNHDCWQGTGSEADPDGKATARAALGLTANYYALRLGAWKLIVLDSITLLGGGAYIRPARRRADRMADAGAGAHPALDAHRDRLAHPDPDGAPVHRQLAAPGRRLVPGPRPAGACTPTCRSSTTCSCAISTSSSR